MAARLEAEVRKRDKSKSLTNCSMLNDESKDAEALEDLEEEVEKDYREMFFHLNLSLHEEENASRRLYNLKHARSLAQKLVNS